MTLQRTFFVAVVVAALAWVFFVGPGIHADFDGGMNGGQQVAPALE